MYLISIWPISTPHSPTVPDVLSPQIPHDAQPDQRGRLPVLPAAAARRHLPLLLLRTRQSRVARQGRAGPGTHKVNSHLG